MVAYDYAADAELRLQDLERRTDPQAARIRWMLGLPDLSRQPGSPVYHLVQRCLGAPCLSGGDRVTFPEVVSTRRNFDLLNAPIDHPSRRPTDTYYVDPSHVLRTQTTSMWSWYLADERVREKLRESGRVTGVSYGKVYRNDEIDRSHYPVFHQIDAVCIAARSHATFGRAELDDILLQIAGLVYGEDVEARILDDAFPFTVSSRQLEVRWNDEWLELVGSGLVHPDVLAKLELDPDTHDGWAFGFGLDRLAMRKMDIPDIRILWSSDERITRQFESIDSRYAPVSKYPATERDISFVVAEQRSVNEFYDIVRACGLLGGESIVEEVRHVDSYRNADKLGPESVSHTFRIVYRSFVRTLRNDEINAVQSRIREAVHAELDAELR